MSAHNWTDSLCIIEQDLYGMFKNKLKQLNTDELLMINRIGGVCQIFNNIARVIVGKFLLELVN